MTLVLRLGLIVGWALAAGCGDDDGGGGSDAGGGGHDAGGGGSDAGGGGDDAGGGGDDAGGGGGDAGGGGDDAGGCASCLSGSWDFGYEGGFRAESRDSHIEDCADFEHTRMDLRGGTTAMCANTIPGCNTDGSVDVGEINAAFAHPDVVAAFAAAPVLYGRDTRPVDGVVFEVVESGSRRTVTIGTPCGGGAGCMEIPPGVAALQELLLQLETERVAGEMCSDVFPGG